MAKRSHATTKRTTHPRGRGRGKTPARARASKSATKKKPFRLDRIVIDGFKSIQHADIKLTNLNILIGANGAGKSNFLGCLELLGHISSSGEQYFNYIRARGGGDAFLYRGARETRVCGITLYGAVIQRISLRNMAGDDLLPSVGIWREPAEPPFKGARIFTRDFSRIFNHINKEFRAIFNRVRILHLNDTSLLSPIKKTAYTSDDITLNGSGGNVAAILFQLQQAKPWHYNRIVSSIRLALPFFDDFVLKPTGDNNIYVLLRWRQKGWNADLPADALSDGSLRFICLATLLGLDEYPPLILIDEPEIGLHPSALSLLAEMLQVAARQTQVIVTTQSPTLVDYFAPEDIIVVDQKQGASTFRRLNEKDLGGWLDEYSLGELWEKNIFGGRP
ncbi:MAG: AAA family ATPase [Planctomycetota bacterium]